MRLSSSSRIIKLAIAFLGAGASAAIADQARAPKLTTEAGQYFGQDNYPPDAMRAGQEGHVVATVSVDAFGHPAGCTTSLSSGSASLDKTTCDIAMAHFQFDPALDGEGHPVASTYSLRVNWVLPKAQDGDNATVTFQRRDADVACVVHGSPIMNTLDPAICQKLVANILGGGGSLDQPVRIWIGHKPTK